MSAQPEHSVDPRVRPIPRTIDSVADALSGAKRMAFYAEVGRAQEGPELNETLHKWWIEALCDAVPGRGRRLANADAGRGLRPLPDMVGE
ncbi:hypothetical protein [Streptomyces xiaopingdaonensis]|uniref:hypothetical protein n=1 Tax=Streptomyces xiaopingdaonensis TaxID=1565415 RepID=UPI000494BAFE|nr:hypothetical protein [Streptomyces xiaopingdaonensis]